MKVSLGRPHCTMQLRVVCYFNTPIHCVYIFLNVGNIFGRKLYLKNLFDWTGETECVEFLIKHDADINAKDEDDETPFGAAVWNAFSESKIFQTANAISSRSADDMRSKFD